MQMSEIARPGVQIYTTRSDSAGLNKVMGEGCFSDTEERSKKRKSFQVWKGSMIEKRKRHEIRRKRKVRVRLDEMGFLFNGRDL